MKRGLNNHRARLNLVELTVPVARHRLIILIWVKLPVLYQGNSCAPLSPPGPNVPKHTDQEEQKPYPSSNPSNYCSEVGSHLEFLMDVGWGRIESGRGASG